MLGKRPIHIIYINCTTQCTIYFQLQWNEQAFRNYVLRTFHFISYDLYRGRVDMKTKSKLFPLHQMHIAIDFQHPDSS